MTKLDEARSALRKNQGAGARWDSPSAPAIELDWARRGTAYFARMLNSLCDAELNEASLVPGWTRRHIVAQVSYQARALTRLTEWAAGGPERMMYASETERLEEVEIGATLPPHALRGLFQHTAVHLVVEWRDLTEEGWDAPLRLLDDHPCTTRDTPMIRAREIWLRTMDLDAGGSFVDMPPAMVDRLLDQTTREWRAEPLVLLVENHADRRILLGSGAGKPISGCAADLLRWISGRGARRLSYEGSLPVIPQLRH